MKPSTYVIVLSSVIVLAACQSGPPDKPDSITPQESENPTSVPSDPFELATRDSLDAQAILLEQGYRPWAPRT